MEATKLTKYNFLQSYTFQNGAQVKNRIVMSPMTEKLSFENGAVTTDEMRYYQRRSGGTGMVITGCANINDLGKGFEGELSASSEKMLSGLSSLASAISTKGTKAILQLSSAGRKSDSKILRGKQPISASDIPLENPNAETPRALTSTEVEQTVQDFAKATKLAIDAGFDGIEIQGGNTNLIQQFLSPASNDRTDKWGGTAEKRMNFGLAIVDACVRVIEKYKRKPFILGYRFSVEEAHEVRGLRLAETFQMLTELAKRPLDYLHISLGNAWQSSQVELENQEPLFTRCRDILPTNIALIVVGNIQKPNEAEKVIQAGGNFVAMGKEFIKEPFWVEKVINDDENNIRYQLDPNELEELAIPQTLAEYLATDFSADFPLL